MLLRRTRRRGCDLLAAKSPNFTVVAAMNLNTSD